MSQTRRVRREGWGGDYDCIVVRLSGGEHAVFFLCVCRLSLFTNVASREKGGRKTGSRGFKNPSAASELLGMRDVFSIADSRALFCIRGLCVSFCSLKVNSSSSSSVPVGSPSPGWGCLRLMFLT